MRILFCPVFVMAALMLTTSANAQLAAGPSSLGRPTLAIESAELGQTLNVHRLGNLFLAGQFSEADLVQIREAGIQRVITLRTDGEIDWDEQSAVEAAGIEFVAIPFRSPESLTDEVFDQIRAVLSQSDKSTLFHCGSANRVGGTWLPWRVLDQGVDLEVALAEARKIGLRTAFIEEKAIDYIERQSANQSASDD